MRSTSSTGSVIRGTNKVVPVSESPSAKKTLQFLNGKKFLNTDAVLLNDIIEKVKNSSLSKTLSLLQGVLTRRPARNGAWTLASLFESITRWAMSHVPPVSRFQGLKDSPPSTLEHQPRRPVLPRETTPPHTHA